MVTLYDNKFNPMSKKNLDFFLVNLDIENDEQNERFHHDMSKMSRFRVRANNDRPFSVSYNLRCDR